MAYKKKKKMMDEVYTIADRLSEVIGNMQKCLQCTICLHTISDPVKTPCGHRFCRACIQTVLENKNTLCPLCNTGINRRSITRDEYMAVYIDRLDKLIESIQLDSGIDILSHLSRPRRTLEGRSSVNTEQCKSDVMEDVKPSCSYDAVSLPKKQSDHQPNRIVQRERRVSKGQKTKRKNLQKEGSNITKYLSRGSISGVEPLPPDELDDCQDEKSMEEKVQSWLENLPETKAFEDPNKNTLFQLGECNLDDTLITSVSENCKGNKVEALDNDVEVVTEAVEENSSRRSMARQLSRSSLGNENNEDKSNDKEEPRTVERIETRMDLDIENPKPSTSGVTRSSEDNRGRSQERPTDIRRTSPCDLLPAMKKNWSSVKEFGKEMRKKKKKLKSLNVSIENKGRSRSLNKPATKVNEEIIETKDIEQKDNRKRRKDINESEDLTKTPSDQEFFEGKKSSAKNKNALEEEGSPGRRHIGSMSQKVPVPSESSFIILQEGEQVKIRNLNSCQMNDIIGVSEENQRKVIEEDSRNRPEETYDDLSPTPLQSRFKKFPHATPEKTPTLQSQNNLCNVSCRKQTDSSAPLLQEFEGINELPSTSKLQVSTPNPGRLSLKKRKTDYKSDDAFDSNADSRLQAVRRDLNREIAQDIENINERESSAGEKSETAENRRLETEKQDIGCLADTLNDDSSRKEELKGRNRPLVTFRKLGKTYKHRRKHVKFLYLGTTSRKSLLAHSFASLAVQKPCNPIDVLESQDLDGGFGNNAQITVNETPVLTECEDVNAVPVKEMEKSESKSKEPSRNELEIIEQQSTSKKLAEMDNNVPAKSQDTDVLLITLDENEQIFQLPIARPTETPKKTLTKKPVKMLSPTKDSQLQFLSLESPTIENLRTQNLIEESEPVKGSTFSEIRGAHSRALVRTSQQASCSSESPCTPQRKRKTLKNRESLSRRMKRQQDDDRLSDHSFSSQATRIRNSDKEVLSAKKTNAIERCESSTTKDLDAVSLSSDMDILDSGKREQKRVYKRILPLDSADRSSPDLVCVNKAFNDQLVSSPMSKRKRDVSPDSDVEADLNVIASSWYEDSKPGERCKKKGKLEETRDSRNSMNATREARNNSSSVSCSKDRNGGANKLSEWQNRRPAGFARNSASEKSNFTGAKRGQSLEDRVALVVDDDSPDFGTTIDKVKDMQNKGFFDGKQGDLQVESLMQDNFDEIMANVVTDTLLQNYCHGEEFTCDRESVECLEEDDTNRNVPESKKSALLVRKSSSSDKENTYKKSSLLCINDDDTDRILTPEHMTLANKSLRKEKFQGKTKAVHSISKTESMDIQSNRSVIHDSAVSSDHNKLPISENVANEPMGKDTFEQDSLMNITQHDLMIKQFEEDLFGKPKSSNTVSEKGQTKQRQQTPQKKKKEGLKVNAKDVEHSGEEDDFVENTPDVKTKTRSNQTIDSPKAASHISSLSQMFEEQFPNKSPPSTTGKSSSGIGTPAWKGRIVNLYQSTPKSERSSSNNNCSAVKTTSTINESRNGEAKNIVKSSIQNVQNVHNAQQSVRQRLCFVCSGLLPSQIQNVKRLSAIVNAKYVTQFDHEVTHVIVKADEENNGASKTLKYLQGIAHRKWIVSHQWVLESLKKSSLVNEEPYEAVDCRTLEAGPRKSRLREKNLFEGFVFMCIGPYNDVSVEQYHDLLRANGAIVVKSLDALAVEKKMLKIIVIQADVYNYEIIEWYKKARAIPIVHDWVIECISQYKLISFYPYLQELSRQDVLALGYPEFLVEEEPDGDSDSMSDEST